MKNDRTDLASGCSWPLSSVSFNPVTYIVRRSLFPTIVHSCISPIHQSLHVSGNSAEHSITAVYNRVQKKQLRCVSSTSSSRQGHSEVVQSQGPDIVRESYFTWILGQATTPLYAFLLSLHFYTGEPDIGMHGDCSWRIKQSERGKGRHLDAISKACIPCR